MRTKVAREGARHAGEPRGRLPWQKSVDMTIDWLEPDFCREVEPRLGDRISGGVISIDEGGINNQMLSLAVARAATERGALLHTETPVTGFEANGGRITAVLSRDRRFAGDHVVLAAGARSGQIAQLLGVDLPVRPIRGQMIALGGMQSPIRSIVWGPNGYLVPRANGLVFAGATRMRTEVLSTSVFLELSIGNIEAAVAVSHTHFFIWLKAMSAVWYWPSMAKHIALWVRPVSWLKYQQSTNPWASAWYAAPAAWPSNSAPVVRS